MRRSRVPQVFLSLLGITTMLLSAFFPLGQLTPAAAADTPNPTSVTIAGSLQSELGCAGDWDPACAATHLLYDAANDIWKATWTVPAGSWEYKAALNNSWDENYGLKAQPGGANIPFSLAAAQLVKFYYDHKTHWVTDNHSSIIVTAPGSYQSEIGCPGDWQPECLRSWLQDPDGDGVYRFVTTSIPVGVYEFKITINETWDLNYGAGGTQNGSNIPFSVKAAGSTVAFSWDSASKVPTVRVVAPGPGPDNDLWWDGFRHDSRDLLYRTPGGAVQAGTAVTLRFRTYHNDATAVRLRTYSVNNGAQKFYDMQPAATDVSCYQPELSYTCDFWKVTLNSPVPENLWYRFIVSDGTDTDYYADNTPALDGGLGSTSDDPVDQSYALMFYDPSFQSPAWAGDAVIYQIFPDRFRNGRSNNDAKTGDVRYDDPVLSLDWGMLPEGFCRNYADAATNCPWRFDDDPPDWSPTKEGPRGRDYYGGDLMGVSQRLNYLQALGINTIYFNPIFDAASNHSYDTQDYYKIDPYFGTQKDWENLVKLAEQRGIRIVVDGVFNHLSSDSPFFDRYHHFTSVGACESLSSPYRSWFYFRDVTPGTGSCVGSAGEKSADYDGWFGFDSIPVINKSNPEVQAYFLTNPDSVSRYWLNQGAAGWRMDVMGDSSFPAGYWETFREVVKSTKSDAFIISETWQKDSTLLRMLRGDRADTTMNYRLRDAILGLLTPGPFDSKGFADSGRIIKPSEFAARVLSIREDYPDAAYYSLMNLVGSHDTERILWALTPGSETRADKEFNAENLATGKRRQQITALIQFSMPGAPTIYYGDEVGVTGDDDPDDRRTYPWGDSRGRPDKETLSYYQSLSALRKALPVLVSGDLKMLLADDASGVVAYGRKTGGQAAVVIINRSEMESSGAIPVADYLPDGLVLTQATVVGSGGPGTITVANGELVGTIGPWSAVLLVAQNADLMPPPAPTGLVIENEGNGQLSLKWDAVMGAAGYNLYRSPLSGGGWVKVNDLPLAGLSYVDTGLQNARMYYYVATALDALGNESAYSNQASGMPHYQIGWANLQWPPTMNHTISVTDRTDTAYGQVWIDGVTSQPGATPTLWAQLGFGPTGSNPAGNAAWVWVDASFNVNAGNNDEFMASMLPEAVGSYDYIYRYSTTGGRDWLYADLNGPVPAGATPANPGKLTVASSGDTVPPDAPMNLTVVSASPAGIHLQWAAVPGDPSLYGYEVLRGDNSGGPYTMLARLTGTDYTDSAVAENATYFYVVRALDTSFNRSGYSNEAQATAVLRTVTLVFNVTVPVSTDATGKSVYIAGFLDRLDGGLPQWNPGGVVLTRVDATHWTITLTGKEATQIEYKYALGSWDYVEKDAGCGEVANRQLTLSYGADGTQVVKDTVVNWRNVSPCGN
jgi:glycosidase